jgi:hypothetical protein
VPAARGGLRRTVTTIAVFSLALILLIGVNATELAEVITLKIHTTTVDDSMGLRFRYVLGGAMAMIEHPFSVSAFATITLQKGCIRAVAPPSDNAHNVFSQLRQSEVCLR